MGETDHATLAALLTTHYTLPTLQAVTPVDAGYLSRNWIVATADNRYFLKQYRFAEYERVAAAHTARRHFHSAGIPTIVPQRTNTGEEISEWSGRYYSLFPFVHGNCLRRGALSPQAVRSIGALLARLHLAGRNVEAPYVRRREPQDSRDAFFVEAEAILAIITRQSTRTPFDDLAELTLRRQLAVAAGTTMDYTTLGLAADHLLHGDYHDGNLFFNDREEIIYLYDWEKTEIAPREIELVRALLFTCFANPHNFRGTFAPMNFALGEQFLAAYHSRYPLNQARLTAAVRARYWGSLCSLWVPVEHYRYGNARVDPFLEANLAEINYFAEGLDAFCEWLAKMIEDIVETKDRPGRIAKP